ncbi:phosphotransferase enzyme family protein [Paenibacillus luteus]|uniref:phosphotransferase enzyme family protein n=1 Tax=Paenibacillus luteus TaxID=2545753 RepID=UPI0019D62DAF|nr:phosphotransferase [Paenibacillus luteus]
MEKHMKELIHFYFPQLDYSLEPVPFGLTNLTQVITLQEEKYVMRIYNRHTKSEEGLLFEVKLTSYLNEQLETLKVPVFLSSFAGDSYYKFGDGTLGAVVNFLSGAVPAITSVGEANDFGRVVGQVASALGGYEIKESEYSGVSFLEIDKLHPLANRSAVASFFEKPPFSIPGPKQRFYYKMMATFEMNRIHVQALPKQLVHHDLLIFNLLAEENGITGVLDFDFTSVDVGFMEFVISFNHLAQLTDGSIDRIEEFLKGYAHSCKHTTEEIEQLQLLTQIYHLAILHIYIGQHLDGRDIEQNFHYILDQFMTRNEWLDKHASAVQLLLNNYLL